MAFVDLSLLKAHVRADDFTEDDGYLSSVLESAEAWVVQATAREADELLELGGGAFPSQLRQAVLLVAGHWYNQREGVGSSTLAEVPYTIQALIRPFRKLSDTTTEEDWAERAESAAERAAKAAEESASDAQTAADVSAKAVAEAEAAVEAIDGAFKDKIERIEGEIDELRGDMPVIEEMTPSEVASDWDEIMNE